MRHQYHYRIETIIPATQYTAEGEVCSFNPLVTNGLAHPYHMDEPTFILKGSRSKFSFEIIKTNRIAPDGTQRFAASHLWLFCLLMSHKKDARLIWINWEPMSFESPWLSI